MFLIPKLRSDPSMHEFEYWLHTHATAPSDGVPVGETVSDGDEVGDSVAVRSL
jgi:hypothetical protein